MPVLRRCSKCRRSLPATRAHFYVYWRKKPWYLRSTCKSCDRKYHRRYMRTHPHKNREYCARDYRKHRRARIKHVMSDYWLIRKDAKMYAVLLAKRRAQERRRMKDPAYAARRRKQKAAVDAQRIRIR